MYFGFCHYKDRFRKMKAGAKLYQIFAWIFLTAASDMSISIWTSPSGQYFVVSDKMTHEEAGLYCQKKLNSVLSSRPSAKDIQGGLSKHLDSSMTYWLDVSGNPACSILTAGISGWDTSYAECNKKYPFICKSVHWTGPVMTTTKLSPSTTTALSIYAFSNISVNDSELYIHYHPMTYKNASQFCQLNFNGNLASSSVVLSVGSALGKYLSTNVTYWLQGETNKQCQMLFSARNSSQWITSSNYCDTLLPFICRGPPSVQLTSLTPSPTSVTSSSSYQGQKGWATVGETEYSMSDRKCSFIDAEQCCKEVGAALSTTLNHATLREVVRILPVSSNDSEIWINGTGCILDNTGPYCDVLAIINGTLCYSKSYVSDSHFCLCQRPVPAVTLSHLTCKEFYQTWKQVGSMQYWKSGKPRTYGKAQKQCNKAGGTLVDHRTVQDPHFLNTLQLMTNDGDFWVKDENSISAGFSLSTCSAINVEAEQISLSTKECSMFLYSICERPVTGTATSIPKTSNAPVVATKPNWMKHHRHEYYVMENAVTYKEAERRCRDKLNSSLAFFTLANAYFEMTLTLNLEPGDYWVGAGPQPTSDNICLLLHVQDWNTSTLYVTDCFCKHRSICRRSVKNVTVTFEPEFLQMLEEMAKSGRSTLTLKRKLTSATDYRSSSKAMGIVGLGVIVLVIVVIVGCDVSDMKKSPKRHRRRVASSTA